MARLPVPSDDRPAPPLWRNVSFELLWSSVAASGFGDRLIQMAAWSMLGFYQLHSQRSSIEAGVYFFFFLPYVALGLFAGWLADTLPRKWILFGCDQARAVVMLALMLAIPAGAAVALPGQERWIVWAAVLAVGALAALFNPAKAAVIPQVVPMKQLQAANAIVLGIAVIASLIGLVAGEPMVRDVSVRGALLTGAVVYAVSGTFFIFLKLRPRTGQAVGREPGQLQRLVDAAVYTVRHRPVLELTLLSMLFWAAANVLLAAIAALTAMRYGPTASAATMMATVGAGMLAGSIWVAWVNVRRESAWLAMLGLLAAGAAMVMLGMSRSYPAALALCAGLAGFFGNLAMICVATLTQSLTPDYMRSGRVFGFRDLLATASAVLVNFVIWRTPGADRVMVGVLYAAAGLMGLVGAWGLWREITRGPLGLRRANAVWRINRAFVLVWHRLVWIGKHHVPSTGPAILAANHTAGIDPLLIQAALPRIVRWIMDAGFRFRALDPVWRVVEPITVAEGASNLGHIRQTLEALKRGRIVGIFPEGGIERGHRNLQPFAHGVAMMAVRSGAPIVPVWIEGTPLRKHMLWHFLEPSRARVTFGKPFHPDPKQSYEQITAELRRRMLELAETKPLAANQG